MVERLVNLLEWIAYCIGYTVGYFFPRNER